MLALALLLVQAAPEGPADIIVRGQRTSKALEACLARGCATPDDVRLSIARAEALFAEGRYRDARKTLGAALSRQRRNARQFPRLVAALYEANATVNLHFGDMDAYRTAIIGQGRTLRGNLPEDDLEVLLMTVRLGDFWTKQRNLPEAKRQFDRAARSFARRGEGRLAALCELRLIALDIALRDFTSAERRLDRIARSPVAADQAVRLMSAVMVARLGAARGEEVDVEALLATLGTEPSAPPVLVKPGKMPVNAMAAADANRANFGGAQQADGSTTSMQWADIGFMVGPDGRVSDVEVLRSSRGKGWTAAYLAEIADRRYAPVNLPPAHPGIYRVERYTLRAQRIVPTGSLIKQASGRVEVQVMDMTRHDAAARKKD